MQSSYFKSPNNNKSSCKMFNTSGKIVPLHFWICFFLDSNDGNYETIKPGLQLNCAQQGEFLIGSDKVGYSDGHTVCILICVLVYLVAVFGFFSNVFNVLVLRKTLKDSAGSLKVLLIMLAILEMFACLFSIAFSTVIMIILENVDRGQATFNMLRYSHILYSYGRTVAIYMTILVTIERYLVVGFPIQSKSWLTPFKSKLYVIIILLFSFFLDLPFVFNSAVVSNTYKSISPNTTLVNFPYIMNGTSFSKSIYPKIRIYQLLLNYVAPFPILLIFNGLLYLSVYRWNKSWQTLTSNHRKEINVAKMFSVVVLILLSCHTVSCILVFFAQHVKVVHRELMLLQILSVTLSAATNFLVYVCFGKPFQEELRRLFLGMWDWLTGSKTSQTINDRPPSTKVIDDI